ncbi:FAD-dependent monooxygenase [Streptomyces massasporeus]
MLLLGDAAHVHSAIGGPGLNLGLQDAVDLGWKPAAELRGHAPQGLLDTYDLEPYPVAQRVNMHTQAQSLLIRPGGDVTALRELFGELLAQPATRQHIANLLSGADIIYDTGPATGGLVGRWAPDLPGLCELARTGRPLLLDPTGTLDAGPWASQVDTATVKDRDPGRFGRAGRVRAGAVKSGQPAGELLLETVRRQGAHHLVLRLTVVEKDQGREGQHVV